MRLVIELEIAGEVVRCEHISPGILKEKIKEFSRQGMTQSKYWEVYYRRASDAFTYGVKLEVAPEDVPEIKKMRHQYSLREIAKIYNVRLWAIERIFRNAS